MRTDVHAHYFPDEYLDALDRCGSRATDVCRDIQAGARPAELEARFEMMAGAGVDVQVLSATPAPPSFASERDSVACARLANDLYAGLAAEYPDRFVCLAVLPLPHVEASLRELARALDELGMVGASVPTSVLGRSLVDPLFEPIYREFDRRALPVLVHPAGESACSPLISGHSLTWMLGAPVEDNLGVLHLMTSGIVARYPRIRFATCHFGGALPLLLPRFDRLSTWETPDMPERPSVVARRLWYDTVAHGHTPGLRAAIETLGADRLVFGSDFPYQRDDWYALSVSYIEDAGLSEHDERGILGGNAAEWLGAGG